MHHSYRNASLVAFVAQLLNVEVVACRKSSRRLIGRRSSLAFISESVHANNLQKPPRLKCRSKATKQCYRSATVAYNPHASQIYFIDSSEEHHLKSDNCNFIAQGASEGCRGLGNPTDDKDVLIYKGSSTLQSREFSLLKPYLEFNELILQQLVAVKKAADVTLFNENTVTSSSSQLYEELEEVEIGQWKTDSNSPFYFASIQKPTDTSSPSLLPLPPTLSSSNQMPPWLSLNESRYASLKLRNLQLDLTPHLSTKEVNQVVSAIRTASAGDLKKIAGASDFCSILVNTLEISDVPALCASAFHYCSLFTVREREHAGTTHSICTAEHQACLQTAGSDAKYLCALAGLGLENYGTHAVKIALDAAKLKSMETLAEAVVRKNGKLGRLRSGDAKNLRSLLLSVNEEGDWRALAIRSAACLYRLRGLEAYKCSISSAGRSSSTSASVHTLEESRASQEALHIYAPLAAQLGMFRLKTELESAAFRTLCPRSHAAVSALSGGENSNAIGEGMRSILLDMTNQMKRLLQEDCSFMDHVGNVSITARVKEPYSIWRKMLKIAKRGDKNLREISIMDIPDAVALRVVFSARKLLPDESDDDTRRREEALCYYILELCTRHWPETSNSRFKDYIKKPKKNGYQSLHYTSRKRWRGSEWPFEVQIRSTDMHRVAEYGVAAHWSYKRDGVDDISPVIKLDKSSDSYLKSVQKYRANQFSQYNPYPSLEQPSHYLEDEIRKGRRRERDERLAPYLKALSGTQTEMTRERVHVFVSVQPPQGAIKNRSSSNRALSVSNEPPLEGTVLSLPRGSRVLDAIRVAEKWSNQKFGTFRSLRASDSSASTEYAAFLNGKQISIIATEQLDDGDIVSILPTSVFNFSRRSGWGGSTASTGTSFQ